MRSLVLFVVCAWCTSCINHSISFQDLDYSIEEQQREASLSLIIDDELEREIRIKSAMTGLAHNWNARPVTMMKQVADIEMPQMFKHYEVVATPDGDTKEKRIDLWIAISDYTFANHKATITLSAIAKAPDGTSLFESWYTESGETQGGKMFWGGAFAMKSAMRQSSLAALQAIFARLRADLASAL